MQIANYSSAPVITKHKVGQYQRSQEMAIPWIIIPSKQTNANALEAPNGFPQSCGLSSAPRGHPLPGASKRMAGSE